MNTDSMSVREIVDPADFKVQEFFKECQKHNFTNNISAMSIKFDWVTRERLGKFWGVFINGRMVSMAGCHWIPEITDKAFRIQFRGCDLPGTDLKKTLSRAHFNSMTFRELIPHQLNWIRSKGDFNTYLSVNVENRNHRAMELLERQGFLLNPEVVSLFGVQQTVWQFNISKYEEVRKRVRSYVNE